MSKRKKFEKLVRNEAYSGDEQYDEKAEEAKEKKEKSTKKKRFSGIYQASVLEKKNPSTRFKYTRERRKLIYDTKEPEEVEQAPRAPFIFMLCVMLLIVFANCITSSEVFATLTEKKAHTAKALLMIAVYILPTATYIFSSSSRRRLYNFRHVKAYVLPITLISFGLLTSFTFLQQYFITYTFSYNASVQAVSSQNILVTILTGALLPAICEEIFVRGVFQYEISRFAGGICGIVAGAFVFAFMHLDLQYFLIYLSAGLILGVLTHITHSVFCSMTVHFLNNTFSILFSGNLAYVALRHIGGRLFMIILACLSFIFLILFLKQAEIICTKRAGDSAKEAISMKEPTELEKDTDSYSGRDEKAELDGARFLISYRGRTGKRFAKVIFSPYMLFSLMIFVIFVVLKLAS